MTPVRNRLIISIIVLTIVLVLLISLFVFLWPRSETSFLEIGLLGKDKLARDYFPNNNSTITVGDQIDWHIYIHNHIDGNQNILLKLKLVNFTLNLPGASELNYSEQYTFFEIPMSLLVDETQIIPIYWNLLEIDNYAGFVTLKRININGEIVHLENITSNNSFFRMIFELWIFNEETQRYEFGWKNGNDLSYASVNMAFRII